jgi:MFS family permease
MTSTKTPDAPPADDRHRWRVLGLLCLAITLSLTTWFSAAAVAPELMTAFDLSGALAAWLTNGVQIGFVVGALAGSLVNLPDLVRLNRLIAAAALLAALANAALLLEPGPVGLVGSRLMVGFALAGVYPPALKLVATWFVRGRGLALGAVIAALTLGSSLPHLARALTGGLDWRLVVALASIVTLAGAAIFLAAREGPFPFSKAVFDPRQIGAVLRDRPLRLANIGYFGHMWELYAMWAWFLAFARAALTDEAPLAAGNASLLTFAVIAAGAGGCLLGGVLSDRVGRTLTTAGMMLVSGACALLIGFVFDGPTWLFVLLSAIWGVAIVGDSAQFSSAVTELADQRFVGTALSLQIGLGFALTVLVIWLVPQVVAVLGWRWSFAFLAIGPFIGAAAMLRLRALPESAKLAGGRR